MLGSNIDNGAEYLLPAPSAHLTAISTVSAIRSTFRFTGTGLFDIINTGATSATLTFVAIVNPDPINTKTYLGILANVNKGSITRHMSVSAIWSMPQTVIIPPDGPVCRRPGWLNAGLIALSHVSTDVYATNIGGGFVGINRPTGRIINCGVAQGTAVIPAVLWQGWLDEPAETQCGRLSYHHYLPGRFCGVNAGRIQRPVYPAGLGQNES